MREFGIIHVGYWEWSTRKRLSDTARSMGAYLLSCRHGNSLGCYRLPREYVSADLGYSVDRVSRGCHELCKHGLIYFCDETKYVFIRKFLKYNPPQNPSHAKGVMKCVQEIPGAFAYWPELGEVMQGHLAGRLDESGKKILSETLTTRCVRPCGDTDTDTDTYTDTHTKSASALVSVEDAKKEQGDFEQLVVDAFQEILPELLPARGLELEKGLRAKIRARIRGKAERRDIDWWREYFQGVRACPHLMGQSTRWRASIDWLTGPENMRKVLAGNYEQGAAARRSFDTGLHSVDHLAGLDEADIQVGLPEHTDN